MIYIYDLQEMNSYSEQNSNNDERNHEGSKSKLHS